jgi:peptidoglycan/LPS O-acetylase OafA/YrhL
MAAWGHTYLTLFYAVILVHILLGSGSDKLAWLRQSLLVRLGAISYSVYLFHPLFLACVFLAAKRSERISNLTDLALAGLALALTLAWCALSLRFLERPLTQAGRKMTY